MLARITHFCVEAIIVANICFFFPIEYLACFSSSNFWSLQCWAYFFACISKRGTFKKYSMLLLSCMQLDTRMHTKWISNLWSSSWNFVIHTPNAWLEWNEWNVEWLFSGNGGPYRFSFSFFVYHFIFRYEIIVDSQIDKNRQKKKSLIKTDPIGFHELFIWKIGKWWWKLQRERKTNETVNFFKRTKEKKKQIERENETDCRLISSIPAF